MNPGTTTISRPGSAPAGPIVTVMMYLASWSSRHRVDGGADQKPVASGRRVPRRRRDWRTSLAGRRLLGGGHHIAHHATEPAALSTG